MNLNIYMTNKSIKKIICILLLITMMSLFITPVKTRAGVLAPVMEQGGLSDRATIVSTEQLIKTVLKSGNILVSLANIGRQSLPTGILYWLITSPFFRVGIPILGGVESLYTAWDIATKDYNEKLTYSQNFWDKTLGAMEVGLGVFNTWGFLVTTGIITTTAISTPVLLPILTVTSITNIGVKIIRAFNSREREKSVPAIDSIPVWEPPVIGPAGKRLWNLPPSIYNPEPPIVIYDPFEDGIPESRDEMTNPSAVGANAYKPNIYLYSSDPKDTVYNVKLFDEASITSSLPLYETGKGWNALVTANGNKISSINGSEDYLFYEAVVREEYFQKETGWLVKGESLEANMKQILDIYHFSEQEKKDFLEFWTNKLDKSKNYIFYNEDTKIVDEAMPLQVKPLPGRSYRIWFYIIEADGDSRDLENPDPVSLNVIPANRCDKGDILVEVGGVM